MLRNRSRRLLLGIACCAFAALAAAPAVGDSTPPVITIVAPVAGAVFNDHLRLSVSATDADGLGRISFDADGKRIRSFTTNLESGVPVSFTWSGARELSPGMHTITVLATDKQGSNPDTGEDNRTTASVRVRRIDVAKLALARTITTIRLSGSGLDRAVQGSVSAPSAAFPRALFPPNGRVRATWQVFSGMRFKTRHRDVGHALTSYRLHQRLAIKGRWRVRVAFEADRPYRSSVSKTIVFNVG